MVSEGDGKRCVRRFSVGLRDSIESNGASGGPLESGDSAKGGSILCDHLTDDGEDGKENKERDGEFEGTEKVNCSCFCPMSIFSYSMRTF
jgi:hypothetical protein